MKKILLPLLLLVMACSSNKVDYTDIPEQKLYANAIEAMNNGDNELALKLFEALEKTYPYSALSAESQIKTAEIYYNEAEYDESLSALNRFIQLHPGNKQASYALYLKAMCYYEQVSDVRRDQKNTQLAISAFEYLINLHPKTSYAEQSRQKLILLNNQLAGKEMAVGRYYLKTGNYMAALNRFQKVILEYETSEMTPEALYRQTEIYLSLGMKDDAQRSAVVLGTNYPENDWYHKAFNLMKEQK